MEVTENVCFQYIYFAECGIILSKKEGKPCINPWRMKFVEESRRISSAGVDTWFSLLFR